jgi:hypothetical protein
VQLILDHISNVRWRHIENKRATRYANGSLLSRLRRPRRDDARREGKKERRGWQTLCKKHCFLLPRRSLSFSFFDAVIPNRAPQATGEGSAGMPDSRLDEVFKDAVWEGLN